MPHGAKIFIPWNATIDELPPFIEGLGTFAVSLFTLTFENLENHPLYALDKNIMEHKDYKAGVSDKCGIDHTKAAYRPTAPLLIMTRNEKIVYSL
jgi:hypothetical protein